MLAFFKAPSLPDGDMRYEGRLVWCWTSSRTVGTSPCLIGSAPRASNLAVQPLREGRYYKKSIRGLDAVNHDTPTLPAS